MPALLRSYSSAMSPRRPADDVRSAHDPDDDDLVRDVNEWARRPPGDAGAPAPAAPAALRDDEVVCRRCRLVVPRRTPDGVVQLLCDDCRW